MYFNFSRVILITFIMNHFFISTLLINSVNFLFQISEMDLCLLILC